VMGVSLCRYLTWKHWGFIMLPTSAVALHMVIHSPLKHLGLDAAIYIELPGPPPPLSPPTSTHPFPPLA